VGQEQEAERALAGKIREASEPRPDYTRREPSKEYVYFIRAASGPVKIGISRCPRKRFWQIQTGSSENLTLLATVAIDDAPTVEARLHETFAESRIRGEWFIYTNKIAGLVDAICAGQIPGILRGEP
jgi:hypothetical protein